MRKILLLLSAFLIVAYSSNTNGKYINSTYGSEKAPNIYTVRKGDTLFSIAWRYGMDRLAIMKKNGIDNPNKLIVGQQLYLGTGSVVPSGATVTQTKTVRPLLQKTGSWVWPIQGNIVKYFNAGQVGANGVRFSGRPNQTVNSTESGVVAYKGNGLKGYGNVVIIKHQDGLVSAYGFLSKTYVKEGQKVKKRQRIGTVGYGANNRLMLHFEIRQDGKPTNPLNFIGSQYHF